tara:strand:- start:33355 stop:33615 length:261 start_codon:yes stop_codon:yes gene_type:complete
MKYLTAQRQAQVLEELEPFMRQVTRDLTSPAVETLYKALNKREDFFSYEIQREINVNKGQLGLVDYLRQHHSINSKLNYYQTATNL